MPQQIIQSFPNARLIGRHRAIFNIKGNNYRLVTHIDYAAKRVYVRFIGTHAQYDRINPAEI